MAYCQRAGVVGPQNPQPIGQHRLVCPDSFLHPPRTPQRRSEVMAYCQRAGVVGPQNPQVIGQHRPESLNGFLHPPRIPQRPSEVMARCQRAGMVGPQNPPIALNQQTIFSNSLTQLTVPTERHCQITPSFKHILMIRAKLSFHITKKITTDANRHTLVFITHQGHSSDETHREEIMLHRITLRHITTIVA